MSSYISRLTRNADPIPGEDGTFLNGRIDTNADMIISTDNVAITMRLPKRLTQKQFDRLAHVFEMGKDMLAERVVTEADEAFLNAATSKPMLVDDGADV